MNFVYLAAITLATAGVVAIDRRFKLALFQSFWRAGLAVIATAAVLLVLDSVTSSIHFLSPAVFGLVYAGAPFTLQLAILLAAFFTWGLASHAFGAVQDVVPDRSAGIASIATVSGARGTVRLAIGLWVVAGLLMLFTEWPGPLAAAIALPYIALAAPYWEIADGDSVTANRGWRRFLWVNYACGAIVTILCIWWSILR